MPVDRLAGVLRIPKRVEGKPLDWDLSTLKPVDVSDGVIKWHITSVIFDHEHYEVIVEAEPVECEPRDKIPTMQLDITITMSTPGQDPIVTPFKNEKFGKHLHLSCGRFRGQGDVPMNFVIQHNNSPQLGPGFQPVSSSWCSLM